MRRGVLAACCGTAALVLTASGCGIVGGGGSKASASPKNWGGRSITVWLMQGDNDAAWEASVEKEFAARYPGAKLKISVKSWTNIEQVLSNALASVYPPDVVDVGNTQVSYYASFGSLLDLGPYLGQLGSSGWTTSMNASTRYQGVQYAAPWYAGNRVVLYNKQLWAKAGLKGTPTTRQQWYDDLDKLQQTPGVSSALWLPGQDWYVFDGFLQDEGAQIVTGQGKTWSGNLNTSAALKAVQVFKKLQSYGQAPKDKDEAHPVQADVFAKGDIGSIIALGWEGATAIADNPKLKGQLGWFPIPGQTATKPAATFLGGSDLAIAHNTQQKELALGFLQVALDDKNESLFAKDSGFLPNNEKLYAALDGNAYAQAAAQSVKEAGYTPLVPTWGNVETAPNPIITQFLTPVLQGAAPAQAAENADRTVTDRLGWDA